MAVQEDVGISRGTQYALVGCVTGVAGWFSGAMAAMLLRKIAASVTRTPNCAELPVPCDWYIWAFAGAVLGLVSLPAFVLWRLRKSAHGAPNSDRG